MHRALKNIWSTVVTLALWLGVLATFYFAKRIPETPLWHCFFGVALSFIFAPVVHELGHFIFGLAMGMGCVEMKIFCLSIHLEKGKYRVFLASPFADDKTQMLPRYSGDMSRRASWYTLGGLFTSALWIALIALTATLLSNPKAAYVLWGTLPYTGYLLLLNVVPFEYATGKTDMAVFVGITRGSAVETNMLAAMEIQGKLFEGNRFSEVDERLYFNQPQLCEEEPLYAVMLDLQYRYALDKGDLEKAAERLNRLALAQEYLSDTEVQKVAAELTYMHAVTGDLEKAEENGKICQAYLKEESVTALRVLAAYAAAGGKTEEAQTLKEKALSLLDSEYVPGVKAFEENLLSRI